VIPQAVTVPFGRPDTAIDGGVIGKAIAGLAQVLVRSVLKSGSQGAFVIDASGVAGVTEVSPSQVAGSDDWI
jgi:hypothetical protein